MRKYGFWKDLTFYFLIEAYADVVLRAGGELRALCEDPTQIDEKLQALADLRKEADEAYNQFRQRLDHAFLTPLDKEDLLEIVQELDLVLGAIERAAGGMRLVAAEGASELLAGPAAKLQESTRAVFELASSLRHGTKHQALPSQLAALHHLNKEVGNLHDAAVSALVGKGSLSLGAAMAWKEVYDRLLAVPERSVGLARLVARLLVKYA